MSGEGDSDMTDIGTYGRQLFIIIIHWYHVRFN